MKLTMKVNLNLNRVKVTKAANRHDITTNPIRCLWDPMPDVVGYEEAREGD